jgi:ABC-2 type transport system ATP-binding protein
MIAVENLTKFYGAHAAIQDLSFSIQKGDIVGLLGLNGAGKTTTLRILSGALIPTSGSVWMEGENMVTHSNQLTAKVGFLPEFPPLYPEMTVQSFLAYVASLKNVPSAMRGNFVSEALQHTGLQDVAKEVIGTLSNGYQRRIGIALALVHKPALVLLDEPTSGLDPVQIVQMRHVIKQLKGTQTVVVSSHILSEIQHVCDRIIVLQEGRLAAEGTEKELGARFARNMHLELHLKGDVARIEEILKSLPEVVSVRTEPMADHVHKTWVEAASDCRALCARALVQAGVELQHMAQVRLELENIFLSLSQPSQGPRP